MALSVAGISTIVDSCMDCPEGISVKASKTLTTLVAAGALAVVAAEALPASADVTPSIGSCRKWQDSNTFGAACTGGGNTAYQAVAVCKNGTAVGGPYRGGESGAWSYAYCTSVNSSLNYGYVQWYL